MCTSSKRTHRRNMRLQVLAMVVAAACIAASTPLARAAYSGGSVRGGCVGSMCIRRGSTFLPRMRGCRSGRPCVKFLGLGEPCGNQGNSTQLPPPVCGRQLHCDPETKRCAPIPTAAAGSRNWREPPMECTMQRTKRGFRCFCRRSRRQKFVWRGSQYNASTNPNLHRLYH